MVTSQRGETASPPRNSKSRSSVIPRNSESPRGVRDSALPVEQRPHHAAQVVPLDDLPHKVYCRRRR